MPLRQMTDGPSSGFLPCVLRRVLVEIRLAVGAAERVDAPLVRGELRVLAHLENVPRNRALRPGPRGGLLVEAGGRVLVLALLGMVALLPVRQHGRGGENQREQKRSHGRV